MKTCSECKTEKSLSEFYKEKKGSQGVKSTCKSCYEKTKKKYYHDNLDKNRERQRNFASSEIQRNKRRQYRKQNADKIRQYKKQYEATNKQILNEKRKMYKQKMYREKGSPWKDEKYRLYMREYQKRKTREDPLFRLRRNLRARLRDAFKFSDANKKSNSFDLIGCTIEHLKQHLESQFSFGMSWANYGKNGWVIDHSLPLKMFNLVLESEQRKCFHWSNLQPLWMTDNIAKGGQFDPDIDTLTSIYLLFEPISDSKK